MDKRDFDQLFTQKVKEYLDQGYVINTIMMENSAHGISVDSRVDLDNGKDVVRVATMHRSFTHNADIKSIVVIKPNSYDEQPAKKYLIQFYEIVEEQEFVFFHHYSKTGKRMHAYYTVLTESERQAIKEKQKERQAHKGLRPDAYSHLFTSEQAAKIVLPFVKRQPKCSRKKISDIKAIVRGTREHLFPQHKAAAFYIIYLKDGKTFEIG